MKLEVRYLKPFLFVEVLHRFDSWQVVEPIEISFSLLVGDTVGDQRFHARWLRIEHKEVQKVSVIFVGDDDK